jgi:hypothetical protein
LLFHLPADESTIPLLAGGIMKFRWIAILAVWTLLSGPIFSSSRPRSTTGSHFQTTPAKASVR